MNKHIIIRSSPVIVYIIMLVWDLSGRVFNGQFSLAIQQKAYMGLAILVGLAVLYVVYLTASVHLHDRQKRLLQ